MPVWYNSQVTDNRMVVKKYLNNNLVKNITNLFIIEGVNHILPIIALPFLFRTLGAEIYGVVASAYSFFIFLNIVIDFGFNLSSTREISLNVNNTSAVNKIISKTICAKLILTFLSLLISVVIIEGNVNFRSHHEIFYLMMGIPIGTCFFPVWFFQGVEKMGYMTFTTTMSKLLSFVPMFVIVRGPSDAIYVSICYSVGFIVASLICIRLLYLRFNVRLVSVSCQDVKNAFTTSAPYFMSRISASLYSVGNTSLLGMICGPVMAGYYDISQKIVLAFTTLVSPVSTALYPYMIKSKNIKAFKKIIAYGSIIGIVSCLAFMILAPFLLDILFNEANDITVITFRILTLCISFVVPSYLLGYPFLAALGHTKYTNNTVMIAGAFYLVFASLGYLAGWFSIYYAALLYLVCEFMVFLFRIYGVKKYKTFRL